MTTPTTLGHPGLVGHIGAYSVYDNSGRYRILRVDERQLTVAVTTVAHVADAVAIAHALGAATENLAVTLAGYVLDELDAWNLDYATWHYATDREYEDWSAIPAPTATVTLTRRVLNAFDNPTAHAAGHLHAVAALGAKVAGQPPSVVRAIRDEIVRCYAAYDGVPVIGAFYDRKWFEVEGVFLANAGLLLSGPGELDTLAGNVESADPWLLDHIESSGHGDFTFARNVADQGYLNVALNATQFHAWRAAQP